MIFQILVMMSAISMYTMTERAGAHEGQLIEEDQRAEDESGPGSPDSWTY